MLNSIFSPRRTAVLAAASAFTTAAMLAGCAVAPHSAGNPDAAPSGLVDFPDTAAFKRGIADRFQFNAGLTLAGSDAHLDYIDLLTAQLKNTCATDVAKLPYRVTSWYPESAALAIHGASGTTDIPVMGAVPYSGITPAQGMTAPLLLLPPLTAEAPSDAFDNIILLGGQPLRDAIRAFDVAGKLVVVPLPQSYLNMPAIRQKGFYTNDPDRREPERYAPTFMAGLIAMQHVEAVLKAAGAGGIIGVLPGPIPGTLYAPYQGRLQGIPGIYLDHREGAQLIRTLGQSTAPMTATLHVQATAKETADYNVVGTIPGSNQDGKEIVLATHTDGFNVVEENGAVAVINIVFAAWIKPSGQSTCALS